MNKKDPVEDYGYSYYLWKEMLYFVISLFEYLIRGSGGGGGGKVTGVEDHEKHGQMADHIGVKMVSFKNVTNHIHNPHVFNYSLASRGLCIKYFVKIITIIA